MDKLKRKNSPPKLLYVIFIIIIIPTLLFSYVLASKIYYSHAGTVLFGSPVIDVPIRIGTANEKIISNLVVPRREFYDFSLRLYTNNDSIVERYRILKISGDGAMDRFGKFKNNGTPIPVNLSIYKLSNGEKKLIVSRDVDHENPGMFGVNFFSKIFYSTELTRGKYEIDIQILESNSDLSDTKAHLFVAVPGNLR